MKKYLSVALTLLAICAVSALVLALVNSWTAPRIKAYEDMQKLSALQAVSAGKTIGDYTEVKDTPNVLGYYELKPSGCIAVLTANGYGGVIRLVAAYSPDGRLLAAQILSDSETPGLGKKAEDPAYMEKFIGKGSDMPLKKADLTAEDAQAVSGASVTFTGISRARLAGSRFASSLEAGKSLEGGQSLEGEKSLGGGKN